MRTTRTLIGIAALGLLGGCLEPLESEFHMTEPPVMTTTAGASRSSEGGGASSSGSASGETSSTSTGASTSTTTTADDTSSTGASSSTGTSPAICGDGAVDAGEECDDGNDVDIDDCDNTCARSWTIFVTSETMYTGKINGIVGADTRCTNRALNAGLPRALNYTALISDSTTDAAERLHPAQGWYRLINGLPVAHGLDALMTGPLMNPVNVNEKSETTEAQVWTGTTPGGIAVPGAEHCMDWMSDTPALKGHWGWSAKVDSAWLYWPEEEFNPTSCIAWGALYCVEQPTP